MVFIAESFSGDYSQQSAHMLKFNILVSLNLPWRIFSIGLQGAKKK